MYYGVMLVANFLDIFTNGSLKKKLNPRMSAVAKHENKCDISKLYYAGLLFEELQ